MQKCYHLLYDLNTQAIKTLHVGASIQQPCRGPDNLEIHGSFSIEMKYNESVQRIEDMAVKQLSWSLEG